MGFMAGFGPAFAKSFGDARERSDRKADDLFKIKYERAIKRQDEISAYEKEQSKITRAAEALLERSGKPKELLPWVKKQVQAGMGADTIASDLEKGKFDFKPAGANPPSAAPVVDAPFPPAPVDDQMSATGMSPAPTAAAPVPQEEQYQPSGLDGLFGGRVGKMRKEMHSLRPKTATQKADARLAEALGQTPEETNAMMTQPYETETDASGITFTPPDPVAEPDPINDVTTAKIELDAARESTDQKRIAIAERRYKSILAGKEIEAEFEARKTGAVVPGSPALLISPDGKIMGDVRVSRNKEGILVDLAGNPVEENGQTVIPMSEDEINARTNLAKDTKETRETWIKKSTNIKSAIRTYATMTDIVETGGEEVLAPMTASISESLGRWAVDANAAIREVQKAVGSKGELPEFGFDALRSAETELMNGDMTDLGTQKSLMDVQRAMFAYYLAASVDQDGRNLAEPERKIFLEMASGGVTIDRFHQGMADILLPQIKNLDEEKKKLLDENAGVKTFEEIHGYIPDAVKTTSVAEDLAVSEDPAMKKARENLKQFERTYEISPDVERPSKNQTTNKPVQIDSKEQRDALPPGTVYTRTMPDGSIKQFTKK